MALPAALLWVAPNRSAAMHTKTLFRGDGFVGWQALNDTIMGGRSQGHCHCGSWGLEFTAQVVRQGGGFISCRSPVLSPPLDLRPFSALRLVMSGDGRRYKLGLTCNDLVSRASALVPGGLRWVAEFDTAANDTSTVVVPFTALRPVVRAKPVAMPMGFDAQRVSRFQLLHSRFNDSGGENPGFRAGPLRFTLHAIEAVSSGPDP